MPSSKDAKDMLRESRFEYGILKDVPCSEKDNQKYQKMLEKGEKLPDGVCQYKNAATGEFIGEFYTVIDQHFSDSEKQEYLKYVELSYKKEELRHIETIKNCVVFFTVLTVISLLISFLVMINT